MTILHFQLSKTACRTLLKGVLWLVALYSICFGLALIFLPCNLIEFFGFSLNEKFFAAQGGVFHLIISYAYISGAKNPENSGKMVVMSILTKFSAATFLFAYFILIKAIPMLLLSGFVDFFMGVVICLLYMGFTGKFEGRSCGSRTVETA